MIGAYRLVALYLLATCSAWDFATSAAAQTFKEKIIGTWKLVSWTRTVEGVESPAFGEGPIGMTIYTPDGHFCSQVMRNNRRLFTAQNPLDGTPEESAAAYAGYIGYCGRFEVNEQEGSISHNVELSWFPNWTGTTQKRFAKFEDDRLIFNFPTVQGDKKVIGVFTYVRAD